MTYKISTLNTEKEQPNFRDTNKARAIQNARELAAELKESTIVRKQDGTPICICEFPYFLRDIKLKAEDITVNRF